MKSLDQLKAQPPPLWLRPSRYSMPRSWELHFLEADDNAKVIDSGAFATLPVVEIPWP